MPLSRIPYIVAGSATAEEYIARQDLWIKANRIVRGSIVMPMGKIVSENRGGWRARWNEPLMDEWVGERCIVQSIEITDNTGIPLMLESDPIEFRVYWFPYYALRLVDSKNKNLFYNILKDKESSHV